MNILDKQSPNATGGGSAACPSSAPPTSGPITPNSADCLIPNSSLIPSSLAAIQPSSTAPSSVSSSSAPHTPIDTLNNPVNCQPDLISNGLPSRPNVSTPSSVFNSSAPNTPMPCPSVGSDANITSPAINHQLDYCEPKMFNSGPVPPPPPQVLASNNNMSNPVLSPSPLNVPPPMCTDTGNKKSALSNGTGGNKKHCNNRTQQNNNNNFANMKCENNAAVNIAKNQMNFPPPNHMANMACLPNGSHNGTISPFDGDNKMGPFVKTEFMGDFPQQIPNDMIQPPMGANMSRPPNCGVGINVPMNQPNHMNAPPNKMCTGNNMPPHGMMKPPPMDPQYMQHQSQIFVFNTIMANQAAEAVDSGQFESIIDFHLSNPHTKNFLEKHSLKLPLQNKPNNLWSGNIRPPRMRGPNPNGMCVRGPNFNGNPCFPYNHNPPGPGPGGGLHWNGHNNWPGQPQFPPNDINNMKMANCNPRPYGPQFNNAPYPLDMQDLTPQQKQHREKQLAILANLQQKLCPELMEPNNRPLSQPPHPNEFANVDPSHPNQMPPLLPENDQMNQMIPSDNFNSSFPPNAMMNQPGGCGDQWQKSGPFPDEKPPPFNGGRRKGSQNANQPSMAHQSPLSQQSMNSPNSCITSSPGNRVPPPPYNPGLRSISSPHPASPAGTSLSLPSPRMHPTNDARQSSFTPGGVRSGPATPSADNANCALMNINSPKSSSRPSNTSPGNSKKAKSSLDNDLSMMGAFPPKSESAQLMPVPSPKQIDYNTFDGHELVIHKQPNAHFQDNELLNSNELSNDLYPNDFMNICSSVNNPPPNMPDMNSNHRFPPNSACNFDSNPKFPPGPDPTHRYNNNNGFAMDGYRPSNSCPPPSFNPNEAMRFPNCDLSKSRINSPADIAFSSPNPMDMNNLMTNNSMPPIGPDGVPFANGQQNHSFNDHPDNPISSSHLQNLQKMTPPFDKDGVMANSKSNMPPNMINSNNNHMIPNSIHPNIPQNPNHRMPNFDQSFSNMPCNELNEPNNFGPNMHPPNMPPMGGYPNNFANSPRMPSNEPPFGMHPGNSFGNMPPMNGPHEHPGSMNGPNSMPMMMQGGPPPNARFPGNVNRPENPANTLGPRYNSPNIQVKPNAPNTIQYLPSRPQGPTSTPPSRPPNLDFLQQSLSMSGKPGPPPPNNGPYFAPNSGGPMQMPPRPMQQGHMNFNRPPMMRPQNMQNGPMPGQPPMPMPPQPPDMYSRPPGPNNMVNGPGNMSGPPGGFPPPGALPNKANGPMPAMHPSEGNQSFNFKQSFPNTSDPNYAAQFHNFQQQLYATNTRNSASNPRMTSNF